MTVINLISDKKEIILKRWFDVILDTYPAETSKFMRRQKDRFANPVGHSISQGVEGLFDCLIRKADAGEVSAFLDDIIRVKAVQESSAVQALSFVFALKTVIREELAEDIGKADWAEAGKQIVEELLDFESRIDKQALLAFDIYMQCREKLYEIRANDVKAQTFRLLQQANLIYNRQDRTSGSTDENTDKNTEETD